MLEYYIKVLASHLYKYTYPSINTTQVDHVFVVTLCMYIHKNIYFSNLY